MPGTALTVKTLTRIAPSDRDTALVREALRASPTPQTVGDLYAAALTLARRATAPLGPEGERRLACACAEAWLYHCLRPLGVIEAERAREAVA